MLVGTPLSLGLSPHLVGPEGSRFSQDIWGPGGGGAGKKPHPDCPHPRPEGQGGAEVSGWEAPGSLTLPRSEASGPRVPNCGGAACWAGRPSLGDLRAGGASPERRGQEPEPAGPKVTDSQRDLDPEPELPDLHTPGGRARASCAPAPRLSALPPSPESETRDPKVKPKPGAQPRGGRG